MIKYEVIKDWNMIVLYVTLAFTIITPLLVATLYAKLSVDNAKLGRRLSDNIGGSHNQGHSQGHNQNQNHIHNQNNNQKNKNKSFKFGDIKKGNQINLIVLVVVSIIPVITLMSFINNHEFDPPITEIDELSFTIEDIRVAYYSGEGKVFELVPNDEDNLHKIKMYYKANGENDYRLMSDLVSGDEVKITDNEVVDMDIKKEGHVFLNDLESRQFIKEER